MTYVLVFLAGAFAGAALLTVWAACFGAGRVEREAELWRRRRALARKGRTVTLELRRRGQPVG